MSEERKAAQSAQHKFEFYFVALTFTLLGLAVQTAPGGSLWLSGVEIVGWLLLLVAGLVGLRKLEELPSIHEGYALDTETKQLARTMEGEARQGKYIRVSPEMKEVPAESLLPNAREAVGTVKRRISKQEKQTKILHRLRSITFVSGLVLILVSRALELL